MNRREVVQKFLVGGTVLAIAPSVLESCVKTTTDMSALLGGGTPPSSTLSVDLSLSQNSALNTAGSSMIIQNILIINTGQNIVALSSICTHQGCTVGYNAAKVDIECPCHGSVFSTSGSVLMGPAFTALHSYPVTKSGTVLTITL